ncbi:MAG TPA: hypothetical protein PKA58_20585 [Polyangium sp.]|nr:hypothetical protein [Polyangium sp.]
MIEAEEGPISGSSAEHDLRLFVRMKYADAPHECRASPDKYVIGLFWES